MLIICLFLCTWIRRACVFIFWAMSLQLRHSKSRLLGLCKQNERAAETSKCINGWMPAKKDLLQQDPLNPNHLLLPSSIFPQHVWVGQVLLTLPRVKGERRLQCLRCDMANASAWRVLVLVLAVFDCVLVSLGSYIYIYIYHIYSIYSRTRLGLVKCRLLMAFHAILNAFE